MLPERKTPTTKIKPGIDCCLDDKPSVNHWRFSLFGLKWCTLMTNQKGINDAFFATASYSPSLPLHVAGFQCFFGSTAYRFSKVFYQFQQQQQRDVMMMIKNRKCSPSSKDGEHGHHICKQPGTSPFDIPLSKEKKHLGENYIYKYIDIYIYCLQFVGHLL